MHRAMRFLTRAGVLSMTAALGWTSVAALADPVVADPARPVTPPSNGSASTTRPASDFAAATAIRMRVPAVDFRGVPLVDVLDFIRDTVDVNIAINWAALEAAGVDRNAPVTLRLRNIPLSRVLNLVLAEASQGGTALSWYIADNVIHLTTKEIADRQMITRVYPVQDLLVDVPNFEGPEFNLNSGGGGGGGGSPFGGQGTDGQETETMQERGEKLVELVKQVVDPDVWVENGGYASIRYFHGHLIVTAPRSTLQKIGG
jgi:hypothetical protein